MKYHKHDLKKVYEAEVDGGHYFEIYKDGEHITNAWTLRNAKEFIDTFDGDGYKWSILC